MKQNRNYKQTEIGDIPEDWEVVNLGSLVYDFRGGAPLRPSDFISSGFKVLPKGGVKRGGKLVIDIGEQQYCSQNYADAHKNNVVDRQYTIVVLRDLVPSGPSIGLIVEIDTDDKYVLAQGVYGFRVIENRVTPRFLIHLSNTNYYRRVMNNIMVGSTQVHITNPSFKEVLIPLPPLTEQQAIAAALSDVDSLLTSLDTLIAKKRLIKQGAMQELVTGRKRLPGFKGEWEVKSLGEIGEIDPENLSSKTDPEYTFKYISLEDVNLGTLKGYTELVFRLAPSRARRVVRKNDILISTVRPNLKSHLFIRDNVSDLICSTGFSVLRCNSSVANPAYVFFHLFAYQIENQIETLLTGSNYPAINSKDVKALQIPIPSLEEQTTIAEILSDMDAEISALEARREKTRLLKQGMMQELLTGRIRLV